MELKIDKNQEKNKITDFKLIEKYHSFNEVNEGKHSSVPPSEEIN